MNRIKSSITELETQIAGARAEFDELRTQVAVGHANIEEVNGLGNSASPEERLRASEMHQGISEARGRLEHLEKHVIPSLEKRLSYYVRANAAAIDIQAARRAQVDVQDEVKSIAGARDQVQARIAAVQAEIDTSTAEALAAEQAAAIAYADAVASGAGEAQHLADEALRAASADSTSTEQNNVRRRVVLAALQAEAAKLDTRDAEVRARGDEAKKSLSRALEIQFAMQWDAAVEQLAQAGAGMSAARKLGGFERQSIFSRDLRVPRMSPDSRALYRDDIHLLGDNLDLEAMP